MLILMKIHFNFQGLKTSTGKDDIASGYFREGFRFSH